MSTYNGIEEDSPLPVLKEMLGKIGIKGNAATIYIFLLRKGVPQYGKDIMKLIKSNKSIVYRSLKYLQANGLIRSTMTYPAKFAAVPLGMIIDNTTKTKKREIQLLEKDKKLLNSVMKSWKIRDTPIVSDEYAILKNQHVGFLKGLEMAIQTQKECLVISDQLARREYDVPGGFRRREVTSALRRKKAQFKFITRIDYSMLNVAKDIAADLEEFRGCIKVRHLDLPPARFPSFIISDEKAITLQFSSLKEMDSENELNMNQLLWTNNQSIIQLAIMLFNRLWDEAVDIRERITELENTKKR